MIHFRVLGVPAPQGSKTRMPNGAMLEGGSATGRNKQRAWRTAVAETARDHTPTDGPLDGPLRVVALFHLPRPAVAKRGCYQYKKPDVDKLIRNSLDGLTDAGIITDDARVACIEATKFYADPTDPWTGADIWITKLVQ